MNEAKPYVAILSVSYADRKRDCFAVGDLLISEAGIHYLPMTDIPPGKLPRSIEAPGRGTIADYLPGLVLGRTALNLLLSSAWRDANCSARLQIQPLRDMYWGLSLEERGQRLSRPVLSFPRTALAHVELDVEHFSLRFSSGGQSHWFFLQKGQVSPETIDMLKKYFAGDPRGLADARYQSDPLGVYLEHPAPIELIEALADDRDLPEETFLRNAASDQKYMDQLAWFIIETPEDTDRCRAALQNCKRLPLEFLHVLQRRAARWTSIAFCRLGILALWCGGLTVGAVMLVRVLLHANIGGQQIFVLGLAAITLLVTGLIGYAWITSAVQGLSLRRALRRALASQKL